MTHPDDGGVTVGLDVFPGLRIVPRVDRREANHLGLYARHVLLKPVVHLVQEQVGIVEATVDQEDPLSLQRVETWSQVLGCHARRVAHRIQHRELRAITSALCVALHFGVNHLLALPNVMRSLWLKVAAVGFSGSLVGLEKPGMFSSWYSAR